jgi:uncharacterized integral membrane protein
MEDQEQRQQQMPAPEWLRQLRTGLAIGALLLLVVFIILNYRDVDVRFGVATVNTQLAWALLIAGLLGFLAGLLAPRIR